MSLNIDKKIMDELYALEKYGVPRTHLECLMWFHQNQGQIVDQDTIKGKRVEGINENGNKLQRRKPIPANEIVQGLHYIHGGGVRGSYKPGGAKLVGYNEKENPPQVWEGEDNFVQAIQTGDGELQGYGREIKFKNNSWIIQYNHDATVHANTPYYEITGGHLQRCHDNKIPIGIIYKKAKNQNEILGLGLVTKISKNKLNYTIEPFMRSNKMNPKFQFENKDFDLTGSTSKQDATYRKNRFKDLEKAIKPVLSPEFNEYTSEVGNAHQRTFVKGAKAKYFPWTWMGFWNNKEEKFDTLSFQIVLNDVKAPLFSVGVWLEGYAHNRKNRIKIITVLKEQKNKVLEILKKLPAKYKISLHYDEDETNNKEWIISKLKLEDIEYIAIQLAVSSKCKLKIAQYFTQKESVDLKENVVDTIAIIFNELLTLERFLNGNNLTVNSNSKQSLEQIADDILSGDPENGKPEIAIERDVVLRILRHLESGKHVILVGAPGVGKTMLAKRILEIYGTEKTEGKEYVKSVATAEWSRYHVIGGLNLDKEWNRGKVSEAAEEGKWLLIDEFNRADINKAFGELFLGIEDGEITLSEEEQKARNKGKMITIPKTFRMIGTMNDYDKNLLLTELSYGLITRFAFVDIKPDENKEKESVKKQIIENNEALTEKDWDFCSDEIQKFFEFNKKVREWRMIGVRTTIDVIRYMISASKDTNEKKLDYLDEALCDYLLPQFDRLDGKTIEETEKASQKMAAKGFTEGLAKMRKDLEAKSNIWNK